MPRYKALRNWNINHGGHLFHVIKDNIYTFPSDDVSQHDVDIMLRVKVLTPWEPPEDLKERANG